MTRMRDNVGIVPSLLAARAMYRYRGPAEGLLDGVLTLPLVLPPTVVGFFLLLVFGRTSSFRRHSALGISIILSWSATVIAAVVVAFPAHVPNRTRSL